VLTGPTASGKTGLAVQVAIALANLPAFSSQPPARPQPAIEIISLDSITVYKHMDIGTAKPTLADQAGVVHHLIDVVSPDQEYSVAEYLAAAHAKVHEIESRGNRPMFVGGTPMYLKAILRGFDPGPPADESFRHAVMQDVERFGTEALRRRLEQVDPLSAAKIQSHDVRRMIRALEFARQTGTPISHRQRQFEVEREPEQGLVFALQTPRSILHRRIEDRVTNMFASGLVNEICELKKAFPGLSKTARTAVGYREVLESDEFKQLQSDTQTPVYWTGVAEQVLFHTRRLARRQETWFRSFREIRLLATHHHDDQTERSMSELVNEMVQTIHEHRIWIGA
jgi:tRNA dimethylallyltransferase